MLRPLFGGRGHKAELQQAKKERWKLEGDGEWGGGRQTEGERRKGAEQKEGNDRARQTERMGESMCLEEQGRAFSENFKLFQAFTCSSFRGRRGLDKLESTE